MKTLSISFLTIVILTCSMSLQAQTYDCGTDEMLLRAITEDKENGLKIKKSIDLFNTSIKKSILKSIPSDSLIIIPIVFHV